MTAPQFYEAARAALKPDARLTFVDDYDFLEKHGINESVPWVMLKGNDYGHMSTKHDKAVFTRCLSREDQREETREEELRTIRSGCAAPGQAGSYRRPARSRG